ncbi:MAG: protease inhibitor I42 family protein [Anaerolineae bacterium]|nr:protease inhibitor I42 family protein [Anaerolineae bacterium]
MENKRLMLVIGVIVIIVVGVIAVGLTMSGNGDDDDNKEEEGETPTGVTVTAEQNGETITLAAGGTLQIELKANATTGYEWMLESELDEAILKQSGEPEYILPEVEEGEEPPVGAGGTSVWKFEAVGAGEQILKMVYVRSFESEEEPEELFSITVTVE